MLPEDYEVRGCTTDDIASNVTLERLSL